MSEYIKRDNVIKEFIRFSSSAFEGMTYKCLIERIPKEAVEEIVYCENCIKHEEYAAYDPEHVRCSKFVYAMPRKGYCCFGKEK